MLKSTKLGGELDELYKGNLLFGTNLPTDRLRQVELTVDGRAKVKEAVQFCLQHNIAPICSVNGDGLTSDSDIIHLSTVELEDLYDALKYITV